MIRIKEVVLKVQNYKRLGLGNQDVIVGISCSLNSSNDMMSFGLSTDLDCFLKKEENI